MVSLDRGIRVFISSTFIDMQGERNQLVKNIFPQIRQICEQRGIIFHEVDLRWGITQSQQKQEGTIKLCLDEIDNCRPFFIGILGHRYGTPVNQFLDEFPPHLLLSYPWLKNEHLTKSITELEILYGVLDHLDKKPHAFFYHIDPDADDISYTDEASQTELADLKRRIQQFEIPVRNYSNIEQLGELVFKDFIDLINTLFPLHSEVTKQQENDDHTFTRLTYSRLYIGSQHLFEQLDKFVANTTTLPLVLTSEEGVGKTTLVASWLQDRYFEAVPEIYLEDNFQQRVTRFLRMRTYVHNADVIAFHFVGTSRNSSSWKAIVERIIFEIQQAFDLSLQEQSLSLRTHFVNVLYAAAKKGRVLLIIDGLDKLEDYDQALELGWLPRVLPENVRLILTTRSGPSLSAAKQRRWPVVEISKFTQTQRIEFSQRYLRQFAKSLDEDNLNRIVVAQPSDNPLFLRTMLEELRLAAIHDTLDQQVALYAEVDTLENLYKLILRRLEVDYESVYPHLVRETLSLLWASRRGLSEHELLILLSLSGKSITQYDWSPLYLALKSHLFRHGGIITFGTDILRDVVEKKYLREDFLKVEVHSILAAYFYSEPLSVRKIEELPWHLAALGEWRRLYDLLTDLSFIRVAWKTHQFEFQRYWNLLEEQSDLSMVDGYAALIRDPLLDGESAWFVLGLLKRSRYSIEARILASNLEKLYRNSGDLPKLQAVLSIYADLIRDENKEKALDLLREQTAICQQIGDSQAYVAGLGNQAMVLLQLGDFEAAFSISRQQEAFCQRTGELIGYGTSLRNQGVIHFNQANYKKALALFQQAEPLFESEGDIVSLQHVLANQGAAFAMINQVMRGIDLYSRAIEINRTLGEEYLLQGNLRSLAGLYEVQADYDDALALYDKCESINRQIGNVEGLIDTLLAKATMYADKLRQRHYALTIVQEAEKVGQESGDPVLIDRVAQSIKHLS